MDQKDDLRHIQVGFKLVARRTKTLLFFFRYLYNKQMACYSKKFSTIIMQKYCINKLGCKSSITKILNNRQR